MPAERHRIEASMAARGLQDRDRAAVWSSVDGILRHGPLGGGHPGSTGLALGYVQSGKTTSITALLASAADEGYRIIVALLGSTNLLLDQNLHRLERAFELGSRTDYLWVPMKNPVGANKGKELGDWLVKGRVVLVPLLKHAGRIEAAAKVLAAAEARRFPVLVVDDEADQASLNTQIRSGTQSSTYEAIAKLRAAAPNHLYVQYTATPYAPLLLEPDDRLRPDFVELLEPGSGYTGGREFFVDNADVVVRAIPTLDEQPPKTLPTVLPQSLMRALGSFVAGTALLLDHEAQAAPVSMLVHSTQRNDVQHRYHFLLGRLLKEWRRIAASVHHLDDLPDVIEEERARICRLGVEMVDEAEYLRRLQFVLAEATLWLVNSRSDVEKISWNVAPVHILVGGNKLDRGFTVEGLTVTYMNRPPSEQIDTLEQRARAFGYRADLLPYCQFFATPRTLKVLRETVDTEYDLRAQLRDWIDDGHSVADWAQHVGLLLPANTQPSRANVLATLAKFNGSPTWHQLRRPSLDPADIAANHRLVERTGLLEAPLLPYGRLGHRTMHIELAEVLGLLLKPWAGVTAGSSPGWRHHDLVSFLSRHPTRRVPVLLMEYPDGGPRSRAWDKETGFVNLLQGSDQIQRPDGKSYPGDRAAGGALDDPDRIVVQVHHVESSPRGLIPPLFTLAVFAGSKTVVRKALA